MWSCRSLPHSTASPSQRVSPSRVTPGFNRPFRPSHHQCPLGLPHNLLPHPACRGLFPPQQPGGACKHLSRGTPLTQTKSLSSLRPTRPCAPYPVLCSGPSPSPRSSHPACSLLTSGIICHRTPLALCTGHSHCLECCSLTPTWLIPSPSHGFSYLSQRGLSTLSKIPAPHHDF